MFLIVITNKRNKLTFQNGQPIISAIDKIYTNKELNVSDKRNLNVLIMPF